MQLKCIQHAKKPTNINHGKLYIRQDNNTITNNNID